MDAEEKIEQLKAVVKEDPTDFESVKELAFMLCNSGENETAYELYLYLLKYFPEDADIYYNMGIINEKNKDLDAAVKNYEKAASIEPEEIDYRFNEACVYINLKNYDKALSLLEKIVEDAPQDSDALFQLGMVYSRKNMSEKAVPLLEKAWVLNPEDSIAGFYLAYEYKRLGRIDDALAAYDKVTEISPDYSWAYFNKAVIYWEKNLEYEAIENLHMTLETNPHDIEAYKLFIKILLKTDNIDGAEAVVAKALSQNPDNGDLLYAAAMTYKKKSDYAKYSDFIKKAYKNRETLSLPEKVIIKLFKEVR